MRFWKLRFRVIAHWTKDHKRAQQNVAAAELV